MRTLILAPFLLITFASPSAAQQKDPDIEAVIDQVNLDSLVYYVRVLTGETSVTLSGDAVTITSRQSGHPGNDRAADFLKQKLASFGLDVEDHFFQAPQDSGRNVLGVQRGTEFPEATYILCAHYDSRSIPAPEPAPGADDNASGSAAVLETARILSKTATKYTIRYALWDEEEVGLVGSRQYAFEAAQAGEQILGVVNLDMIGWDSDDDGLFNIHQGSTGDDAALTTLVEDVNATYELGLIPFIPAVGTTRSDHAAFWEQGYPAVLIIENFGDTSGGTGSDFNAFYHSPDDKLEHYNLDYFHTLSKLAAATVASLASVERSVSVEHPEEAEPGMAAAGLASNHPNPFSRETTISYSVSTPVHVTLKVFDLLGREVATLVDAPKTTGRHEVSFDGSRLPGGVYFYHLQAGPHAATKTLILLK